MTTTTYTPGTERLAVNTEGGNEDGQPYVTDTEVVAAIADIKIDRWELHPEAIALANDIALCLKNEPLFDATEESLMSVTELITSR